MLLPLTVIAQQPVRQFDFVSRKQSGLFSEQTSISNSGDLLLVTFNDLAKKSVFELTKLSNGQLLATGNLEEAIPHRIIWSPDDEYLIIEYIGINPVCYDVINMKKLFVVSREGTACFMNTSLLLNSQKKPPEIFLFNEAASYRFTIKGQLIDSIEHDDYYSATDAWYNIAHRNFVALDDNGDGLHTYSTTGKYDKLLPISGVNFYDYNTSINKDGDAILFYNKQEFSIIDANTGKTILHINTDKLQAACFTPDKRNILYKTDDSLVLINLNGKRVALVANENFYSDMYYSVYGSELVCLNLDGGFVFSCKNYFPSKQTIVKELEKPTPPIVSPPVVTKKDPVKPVETWKLSYTISDFVTPFPKDSFYLYSTDKKFRYHVKYAKSESGILWENPYNYYQYFGMTSEEKFQLVNFYILDMLKGEAKIATYGQSGLISKETMIGGNNLLAKIVPLQDQSVNWTNNMYGEETTLSSKIIDNIYKGKKAKGLTITRKTVVNGVTLSETYYYQQGVGLIKIEAEGKTAFER